MKVISSAARPSHVCARCLLRQSRRHYATYVVGSSAHPPPPPPSGAARLTNRRLISLVGPETPKFMQGIISNSVRTESTGGLYTAFLTAQGKVLHDTFIYPTLGSQWHQAQNSGEEPGYLVEVDSEQADMLLKHLKRHKLRSKFKLRMVEDGELNVWSVWRGGARWTAHGQPKTGHGVISLTDCRAPGMGERLVLPDNIKDDLADVEETSLAAYTLRRYLRGVPEGQLEMPRDDCLPMNCNLDIMGGIDFKKGCYVGQELTIRTHHTGVVRRRILPVMVYDRGSEPPGKLEYKPSSSIDGSMFTAIDVRKDDQRKRSVGKFLSGIGNIGLAMCRLEQMTDLKVSSEPSSHAPDDRFLIQTANGDEFGVKAFVPDWVRGNIREPRVQKRVE